MIVNVKGKTTVIPEYHAVLLILAGDVGDRNTSFTLRPTASCTAGDEVWMRHRTAIAWK
jgi:hypothetical protein